MGNPTALVSFSMAVKREGRRMVRKLSTVCSLQCQGAVAQRAIGVTVSSFIDFELTIALGTFENRDFSKEMQCEVQHVSVPPGPRFLRDPELPHKKSYFLKHRCLKKNVTLQRTKMFAGGAHDESTQQTRVT
jgi:hypothetical protein